MAVFPAPEGGSDWVRSTLGALPMLQIVPTAGITDETVAEYLSAGAALGGAVSYAQAPTRFACDF